VSSAGTATRELGEWTRAEPPRVSAIGWVWLVVVVGVPAAVLAVIALLLAGGLVAVVVLVAYALGLAVWIATQGRLALRSVSARPLPSGSAPRLENVVSGVSADIGRSAPPIWTTADVGPNAMVCLNRGAALTVSRSAIEELTRTELEAVIAHTLLRASRGSLWRGSLAAALGPAAGPVGPHVGPLEDGRAAAWTRFPPALTSALAKCDPVRGRFAVLWFAGIDSYHASIEARIAALNEL
jgi:hypothetical protein